MAHLPSLTAVRAFEAAARHRSFRRAAVELSVTPAAVSQQVRGLEDALGVELFRRLPRRLELTDAGRGYWPALSRAFAMIETATRELSGIEVRGRLVVSALPSFAGGWLLPRVPEFVARHPEIDLVVEADQRKVDLAEGRVDVAIRYGRPPFGRLRTDHLLDEEVFPVCAPALLNTIPPVRKLADLLALPLIHDCQLTPAERWLTWAPWLDEIGVREPGVRGVAYSDSVLIAQAAVAGQGVALGRSALVGEQLRAGLLVRPLPVARPAEYGYYVLSLESAAGEPKVAAFRDWIRAAASSLAPSVAKG